MAPRAGSRPAGPTDSLPLQHSSYTEYKTSSSYLVFSLASDVGEDFCVVFFFSRPQFVLTAPVPCLFWFFSGLSNVKKKK